MFHLFLWAHSHLSHCEPFSTLGGAVQNLSEITMYRIHVIDYFSLLSPQCLRKIDLPENFADIPVAMKMGRRLRCSSVTYRSRYAPSYRQSGSERLAGGPF
jgi:hypothetical protein